MSRSRGKHGQAEKTQGAGDDPGSLLVPASLDRKDGPLYRQVAGIIREPILSGRLKPGDPLPREADLAERFGVSLITIRQALRDLQAEGRIIKQPAKPAVIAAPGPQARTSFDFNSLAAIIASTEGRHLKILSYRKRKAERAQQVFSLGSREASHCLQAILYVDSRPVCQNTFYFAPSIGAQLKRSDFDDIVVFRSVQRRLGVRLSGAQVSVRAEVADADLARQLDYHEGGPVLVMELLYLNTDGQPVELTINRNRADWFSLNFTAPNDLS